MVYRYLKESRLSKYFLFQSHFSTRLKFKCYICKVGVYYTKFDIKKKKKKYCGFMNVCWIPMFLCWSTLKLNVQWSAIFTIYKCIDWLRIDESLKLWFSL